MKYFTRYAVYEDGRVKEIKVSEKEVKCGIKRRLKKDKEMLDILKKL